MGHKKKEYLPLDTAVRKAKAEELYKGQIVYYPVLQKGNEYKVQKYRPGRIRKVEAPVVRIQWLDTSGTIAETMYINMLVVPVSDYVMDDIDEVETFMAAKQPDKPAQVHSVAPLIGIPRDQQETGVHSRALIAVVKEKLDQVKPPAQSPADEFDDWIRMGAEIVHPATEKELQDASTKIEQFRNKLGEIDAQHRAHIKDIEEELARAKTAHAQDRAFVESRLKHFQEIRTRLEERKRVLAELKKLL